jgi:ferredoxin
VTEVVTSERRFGFGAVGVPFRCSNPPVTGVCGRWFDQNRVDVDSDAGVRLGIRSAVVMRLRIDADMCTGHGRCYALAPEVFEPDDDGHGLVLHGGEVPAGLEEVARRAANNCPERAITVEE